jgi:hypothetical protein
LREPDYPRNKTQDKERRYDADELAVIVLVFSGTGKCFWLPGTRVVCAGGVCALDEFVVVGAFRDLEQTRGGNNLP